VGDPDEDTQEWPARRTAIRLGRVPAKGVMFVYARVLVMVGCSLTPAWAYLHSGYLGPMPGYLAVCASVVAWRGIEQSIRTQRTGVRWLARVLGGAGVVVSWWWLQTWLGIFSISTAAVAALVLVAAASGVVMAVLDQRVEAAEAELDRTREAVSSPR
jgi:hypothetical protein